MAQLLRWTMITVLLLRVAAGSAWGMPALPAPSNAPAQESAAHAPCHAMAADTSTTHTAADAPSTATVHGHGAHCVLCFPAVSSPVTFSLALARHTVPTGAAAKGVQWVRAPELRPPI